MVRAAHQEDPQHHRDGKGAGADCLTQGQQPFAVEPSPQVGPAPGGRQTEAGRGAAAENRRSAAGASRCGVGARSRLQPAHASAAGRWGVPGPGEPAWEGAGSSSSMPLLRQLRQGPGIASQGLDSLVREPWVATACATAAADTPRVLAEQAGSRGNPRIARLIPSRPARVKGQIALAVETQGAVVPIWRSRCGGSGFVHEQHLAVDAGPHHLLPAPPAGGKREPQPAVRVGAAQAPDFQVGAQGAHGLLLQPAGAGEGQDDQHPGPLPARQCRSQGIADVVGGEGTGFRCRCSAGRRRWHPGRTAGFRSRPVGPRGAPRYAGSPPRPRAGRMAPPPARDRPSGRAAPGVPRRGMLLQRRQASPPGLRRPGPVHDEPHVVNQAGDVVVPPALALLARARGCPSDCRPGRSPRRQR